MDDGEELLSRPRHPRPDRTDRYVQYLGGLVVPQPVELGQDERRPTVVVEGLQQFVEFGGAAVARHDGQVVVGQVRDPLIETSAPAASPCGVGARRGVRS